MIVKNYLHRVQSFQEINLANDKLDMSPFSFPILQPDVPSNHCMQQHREMNRLCYKRGHLSSTTLNQSTYANGALIGPDCQTNPHDLSEEITVT